MAARVSAAAHCSASEISQQVRIHACSMCGGGKQSLLHICSVGRNSSPHRFAHLRILVRMFGDKRLKQPENIVHDLHLPITPRPGADTDSRYPQALTD